MYGSSRCDCETWTISDKERKRGLWNKSMSKIKWTDRIRNGEVLDLIREKRILWKNLKKSSDDRTHVETLGLLRDILESEVGKKRSRSRLEYFPYIMTVLGCETVKKMKRLLWERVEWVAYESLLQTGLRTEYSIIMIINKNNNYLNYKKNYKISIENLKQLRFNSNLNLLRPAW